MSLSLTYVTEQNAIWNMPVVTNGRMISFLWLKSIFVLPMNKELVCFGYEQDPADLEAGSVLLPWGPSTMSAWVGKQGACGLFCFMCFPISLPQLLSSLVFLG